MSTSERIFWFVVLAIIAAFLLTTAANADEGHQVTIYGSMSDQVVEQQIKNYSERTQEYIRQVDAEIQRRHELEMEKAKIEVLGRLQQLGATQVSANASADSHVNSRVSARQENN